MPTLSKPRSYLIAEKVALLYFVFAMLWILTSDWLLGLLVQDPALLVSLGMFKGVLFVTVTSVLFYLVMRLPQQPARSGREYSMRSRELLLVYGALMLLVPLVVFSVLRFSLPQTLGSAQDNLAAIHQLKQAQLSAWLQEREGEVERVQRNPAFTGWVQDWQREQNPAQLQRIRQYAEMLNRHAQFDFLYLVDTQGDVVAQAGDRPGPLVQLYPFLQASAQTGHILFADFVPDAFGEPHLVWVVPVGGLPEIGTPPLLLVMGTDPAQHLYPLLDHWPGASPSGEFLIMRLDGASLLLLNPTRSGREVLSRMSGTLVDGVLAESLRLHELSYRELVDEDGNALLAVASLLAPGWILLTQQHRSEVLAPVYSLVFWVGLLAFATAATLMLAVRLLWQQGRRQQQLALQAQELADRKRHEAELVHQRNLYDTLSETNQMIIRCRDPQALYTDVCRIAVEHGGLLFAWLGIRQDQDKEGLQQVAAYGEHADRILSQYQAGRACRIGDPDPVCEALYTGQPVIHRAESVDEPYAVSASYPVVREGCVVAVLNLYATEADFFSADICATLSEMAEDIAYALRYLEQESALKDAVKTLESSPVTLFRWEKAEGWPVSYVSDNVSRWGYTPAQFLSGELMFEQVIHPEDRVRINHEVSGYIRQQRRHYRQEYRILKADGGEIWVEDQTHLLLSEQGDVEVIEGVLTDISERKQNEMRLEYLARHDPLTGLPNRLRVLEQVDQQGVPGTALLLLDLDGFRDINDTFGHFIGDQLLQVVASVLRGHMDEQALLARLGGDEFVILTQGDAAQLSEQARQLIHALQRPMQLPEGMEVRIGACIGISVFSEAAGDAQELLRQADTALYQAKERGRDQICFYSEAQSSAVSQRLALESRLRSAGDRGELEVYYQPQIEIATGRLVGAEALLRWLDPEHGFVSPAEFIPIAEQSGLIGNIGHWVMESVCRTGAHWHQQGYQPLRLAVNLSIHQLRHADIPGMVASLLEQTGFDASFLEVELTESALMHDQDEAPEALNRLRALGVTLAIDDFGTGYSSLAYLKTFPLDVLKIDKRFIDELETSADDREIVTAIIAMGHSLGLRVLAEGVEREGQLQILRDQGCDLYQGYLFSRPIRADEFVALLDRRPE